jgi:Targeting protein for Xklp2 (TPX2) domain
VPISPDFVPRPSSSRPTSAPPVRHTSKAEAPTIVSHGPRELTTPREFNLIGVRRHSAAKLVRDKQRQIAEKLAADLTHFQAKDVPATLYHPHVVQPSGRAVTAPEGMHLIIEERAILRRQFDEAVARRNEARVREKEEETLRLLEKEREEIRHLRMSTVSEGGTVFEARPVMTEDKYRSGPVVHRKLTEPESPHLSIDLRMSRKHLG